MGNPISSGWRFTYLLGVALLLPVGTAVLVIYYFARLAPAIERGSQVSPWAFSVIAIAGGLSALMAVVITLFATATWRARLRYEQEYRHLQRYLNEDVARERIKLQRNLDLVSAAQQVSMVIKQEVDFERILAVVLEQIEHFARSECVTVYVVDRHEQLRPTAERRRGVDAFRDDVSQEFAACPLVDEAVKRAQAVRSFDENTGDYVFAVYFSTPEGVHGAVRVARNALDDPDFHEDLRNYEQALQQLVRMVSLGLKAASMWDRAIRDEKTGLYNANYYADQVRRHVAAARRSGTALSLVMLDIDKFKHINDTYGHLAGDAILEQVSAILMQEARESDTPYRYGGEELCVICASTPREEAARAAERLRQAIAHAEFRDERGRLIPVSASFGVAQFIPHAMPEEKDLKEACDRALYVAKEHGRNQVVVCEGGERFHTVERGGDVASEVKRRMGLAGDNTPLTLGPAGREDSAGEPENDRVALIANDVVLAAGTDSERARVVDSLVREAAEFLSQSLSARLATARPTPAGAENKPAESAEPEKASETSPETAKPKRRPRKVSKEAQAGDAKPARKRRTPAGKKTASGSAKDGSKPEAEPTSEERIAPISGRISSPSGRHAA